MGRQRGIGGTARGYLSTLAGVGAAALITSRLDEALNTLNISLIYLLVVLIAAIYYGYGPAIAASVLGVLSFYFEYYPPYGINADLQLEDWLTLLFFLGFAVATSRLASSARARAEEARIRAEEALARQRELAMLRQLGEGLRVGDDLPALLAGLARQIRATFALQGCTVLLAEGDGSLRERAASRIDPPALSPLELPVLLVPGQEADRPGGEATSGIIDLPLRCGAARLGLLRLVPAAGQAAPTGSDLQVLETFAAQAGVAIERAILAAEARDAAVLREADRLKTSLLRLISHDLRTPLATIKARASSLLEGDVAQEPAEWQEGMRAIDLEADRLERLVREVLDLSRIEAGALHPHLECYTAEEVIGAVLPHLESRARLHRLVLELPEELPAVRLDLVLIGQVLTNLLENAFKYAPAGSVVRISAEDAAGGLLLRVEDSGPGIPPELRERVFDAFYRLDRALERGAGGAGLGLAICRGLVAAHGGWIRAEQSPEGGAAFLVWLPRTPAPRTPTSLSTPPGSGAGGDEGGDGQLPADTASRNGASPTGVPAAVPMSNRAEGAR